MNTGTITAVGIDVSKHKSTVAARRPGGEVVLLPFDVEHTAEGLKKLVAKLRQLDGEIRIVMEHTGMYWRPIAMTLKEVGFYVSVVNAILMVVYCQYGVPSRVGIPSFVISAAMSAVLCPDRYRAKIIRMISASDSSISRAPFRRR